MTQPHHRENHRTLAPKSQHNMTPEQKRERLTRWMHWRKAGYLGANLERRTKLRLIDAKRLAAELNVSLEGIV